LDPSLSPRSASRNKPVRRRLALVCTISVISFVGLDSFCAALDLGPYYADDDLRAKGIATKATVIGKYMKGGRSSAAHLRYTFSRPDGSVAAGDGVLITGGYEQIEIGSEVPILYDPNKNDLSGINIDSYISNRGYVSYLLLYWFETIFLIIGFIYTIMKYVSNYKKNEMNRSDPSVGRATETRGRRLIG